MHRRHHRQQFVLRAERYPALVHRDLQIFNQCVEVGAIQAQHRIAVFYGERDNFPADYGDGATAGNQFLPLFRGDQK